MTPQSFPRLRGWALWSVLCTSFGLVEVSAGEAAQQGAGSGQAVSAAEEGGRLYYVSPDGDDANPGTQSQPFGTIQRAADLARSGDTVRIRGGTYRESVQIKGRRAEERPILFCAVEGELARISGADPVEGPWTRHERNIADDPGA